MSTKDEFDCYIELSDGGLQLTYIALVPLTNNSKIQSLTKLFRMVTVTFDNVYKNSNSIRPNFFLFQACQPETICPKIF